MGNPPKFRLSLAISAALLVLATRAIAAPNFYYQSVDASQANSTITFGFPAGHIDFVSDGASDACHYTVKSAIATTADPLIKSGEFFNLGPFNESVPSVGIICNSGQAATIRVYAW